MWEEQTVFCRKAYTPFSFAMRTKKRAALQAHHGGRVCGDVYVLRHHNRAFFGKEKNARGDGSACPFICADCSFAVVYARIRRDRGFCAQSVRRLLRSGQRGAVCAKRISGSGGFSRADGGNNGGYFVFAVVGGAVSLRCGTIFFLPGGRARFSAFRAFCKDAAPLLSDVAEILQAEELSVSGKNWKSEPKIKRY